MSTVTRYAETNARIRAMLSQLLGEPEYKALAGAESVEAAWAYLVQTAYGAWLPSSLPGSSLAVEKALWEASALHFKKAGMGLRDVSAEVAAQLASRWELDGLEFLLRLWHGHDTALASVFADSVVLQRISVEELLGADSLEAVAHALQKTLYHAPIIATADTYREKRSILFVELALEREYYRRLLSGVRTLGGAEAIDAKQILAAEIDLVNLSWLARLAQYYAVPLSEARGYLIPGPSKLTRQLADPALTSEELAGLAGSYLTQGLGRSVREASGTAGIDLIEAAVGEMGIATGRRLLARFPFSITCVFSFYFLVRVELSNLRKVFAGRLNGLGPDDIMPRLHGVR